jgi:hypothetical protein
MEHKVSQARTREAGLNSAVHSWELFVRECERGYQGSIYEFDNDLSARDFIDAALADTEDPHSDELERFRARVRIADERFRSLALEGSIKRTRPHAWWHGVIVRIAGQELATDLQSEYGVSVTIVDPKKVP